MAHTRIKELILKYDQAVEFLKEHKNDDYIDSVLTCMKDRVKVQHSQLLSDVLILLPTQGWDRPKINEMAELAIDRIVTAT